MSPPDTAPKKPVSPKRAQANVLIVMAITFGTIIALGLVIVLGMVWFVMRPAEQEARVSIPTIPVEQVAPPDTTTQPAATTPITPGNVARIVDIRHLIEGVVGPVAYSPDGTLLAIGMGDEVLLHNAETLEMIGTLRGGHTQAINALAFTPPDSTGRMLLATSAVNDLAIAVWDTQTGEQVWELGGHTGWIRSLDVSPDGTLIASGSTDTTIKLWDATRGTLVQTLEGPTDMVSGVTFDPTGTTLAATSRDGTVRRWDVQSGEPQDTLFTAPTDPNTGQPFWTTGIAYSPDGSLVAVGLVNGAVSVLDASDGREVYAEDNHTGWIVIRGLAFSPDGEVLASASLDGLVRLWNPRTGEEYTTFDHRGAQAFGLAWHPDGDRIVSSSDTSGEVLITNARTGELEQLLPLAQGSIQALAYSKFGRMLGTSGINGVIRVYGLEERTQVTLANGARSSQPIAFASDVDLLAATADQPGRIVLFNLTRVVEPEVLFSVQGAARTVAISPGLGKIAAGSSTGQLTMWNRQRGRYLWEEEIAGGGIAALAFDGRGEMLAVSSSSATSPTIELRDAQDSSLLHTLSGHTDMVTALAMQPAGTLLASISRDGTLRLWESTRGETIRTIPADDEREDTTFTSITFSPDGTLLAAGTSHGRITFWDMETEEPVYSLETRLGAVLALDFRPDGTQLAASLENEGVWLFEVRDVREP